MKRKLSQTNLSENKKIKINCSHNSWTKNCAHPCTNNPWVCECGLKVYSDKPPRNV